MHTCTCVSPPLSPLALHLWLSEWQPELLVRGPKLWWCALNPYSDARLLSYLHTL